MKKLLRKFSNDKIEGVSSIELSAENFETDKNGAEFLSKNTELIMIVFSLGVFISTFYPFISGNRFISIGGETYQKAAYIAASSFGLNLFYITWGTSVARYSFVDKIPYKIFQVFILIIQIMSVVISGGRGGTVLVTVYTLCYLCTMLFQKKAIKLIRYIAITAVVLILILIILDSLSNDGVVLINQINRIFEYISIDGIKWEGTSGRDIVYSEAIKIFLKNPIFGVGPFNYQSPHNIFLEILLISGLIGMFVFIIYSVLFFYKLYRIVKLNFHYYLLIVIFIYPSVMLMFSGTLFRTPEFAFIVSFVYFYSFNNNLEEKK